MNASLLMGDPEYLPNTYGASLRYNKKAFTSFLGWEFGTFVEITSTFGFGQNC